MDSTLEALDRRARLDPAATALVGADARISCRELHARVHRCADELTAQGVHTLALVADNSVDWVVADLAAQLAGIVAVPIPVFFSPQQIRHAIDDSGSDAILADRALPGATDTLPRIGLGDAVAKLTLYRRVSHAAKTRIPSRTAKVSYTSGTTAAPKGACLPQRAMDDVADSLCAVTSELALERHLCALPLALLLENIAGVYAPLRAGMEICVPSLTELGWAGAAGFHAPALLRCIERYRPDSLILVPQMLSDIVHALEHGAERPRGLAFVAVGGGHVAPALLERAIALGLPVHEGYGLTESASVVALSPPVQRRRGSVGRPLAHSKVRISTSGEILVSGSSFLGYVGLPGERADEIATGDLGRIDADGYLYVTGRKKNVFITSFGRNVSPEWIEAELVDEPPILQAAVFGDARPWSTAVVVAAPGASAEAIDAALQRVNARLPDYAHVGDWIAATAPFSASNGLATSNGRNRRDAIWRRYAAEINAQYDKLVAEHQIA